jgi:hypothetical protein
MITKIYAEAVRALEGKLLNGAEHMPGATCLHVGLQCHADDAAAQDMHSYSWDVATVHSSTDSTQTRPTAS